ncbi:hypothetical protein [Humidesulfovibrio idahonensis]
MNVLVIGTAMFALGFCLHTLLARLSTAWRRPGRLLLAFLLAYLAAGALLAALPQLPTAALGLEQLTLWRGAHLALYASTLLAFYFLFYMGVIDDSPTLTVIRKVWRSGDAGLDEGDLASFFTDERFLLPRLEYMLQKNMIRLEGGRYVLAEGGRRWLAWLGPIQNFTGLGRPG